MGFTKIENEDLIDIGVIGLPDTPGLSTAAMQAKLEETSRSVVIPKHNSLIDELEDTTSATYLGATPITGRTSSPNVQAVMEKLSTDLKTVEDGMAEAIQDAHTHDNKAIIDKFDDDGTGLTYDGDPVGAVTKVNNKTGDVTLTASDVGALPDFTTIPTKVSDLTNDSGYQTAADVSTAISGKEDKSNLKDLAYIDKDGQSSTKYLQGDGTWQSMPSIPTVSASADLSTGTKIGSVTVDNTTTDFYAPTGGASDAYKTIEAAGSSFVASGADTFKINAGSNVTITALSSPDKGITISATGGGQSTGDMLMSDYDPNGTVKSSTNGITGYVASEIEKLDVSDSAVSGQYVSAVSESDGKISVTRASLPTITDTYDGTSSDGMSGKAVKSAIDALDVTTTGAATNKTVTALTQTDGKISATYSNISITKSQISDFPTIPTITDTYSSVSHDGMSGVAVASALDGWTASQSLSQGDTSKTFTGLNSSYGYKPFVQVADGEDTPTGKMVFSGTSATVTFDSAITAAQAAGGAALIKLRIFK